MFINTLVSNSDIGDLIKVYAEKARIVSRKRLISSFTLQTRTLITLLSAVVQSSAGANWCKITPLCWVNFDLFQYFERYFKSFVLSAVNARRQGDDNSNSRVVSERRKSLAKIRYGYQNIYRSRHTETKHLSDEKTYAAINSKLFKKLDHVKNLIFEVDFVKEQIEHREPDLFGFSSLGYAKVRLLERYYKSFSKSFDVNKFEGLEMDTDSLHLASA